MSGRPDVDAVIAFLVGLEDTAREEAAGMGCNMAHHDARARADGIAAAIDAIREEFDA